MADEVNSNQAAVLAILRVVGAGEAFRAQILNDHSVQILRPGTESDPLIAMTRIDFDDLCERGLFVAPTAFFTDVEEHSHVLTFQLS